MRRPEGTCASCWQHHDYSTPCWPFTADARVYGSGAPGEPTWETDRFESFVLDATNPRQDTRRGAPGFQIEEAKAVAAAIRAAIADGTLTIADLQPPAEPEPGWARRPVLTCQAWANNGELIADVARLGYITGRVLDPTYENGLWWTIHRPEDLTTRHRPTDGSDFRDLSEFADGSFDTIGYDPPYAAMGGKETSTLPTYNSRFGRDVVESSAESVQGLIDDGLTEMWRLTADGGITLAKTMNYVWNGDLWLGVYWTMKHAIDLGFIVEEWFIMYVDQASTQPKLSRCLHCGVAIQRRSDHETWTDKTRKVEPSAVCRRPHPFRPHQPDPDFDPQDHAHQNLSVLLVLRKPKGKRPTQYQYPRPEQLELPTEPVGRDQPPAPADRLGLFKIPKDTP